MRLRVKPTIKHIERIKRNIAAALVAAMFLCVWMTGAPFADADDSLTVRVGYLGGDYEVVKTFTTSELRSLGTKKQVYTYFNQATKYGLPYDNPVLQVAEGVELATIIRAAGIDLGSVQRVYFNASDGYAGVSDFTASFLFGMPRYYYPHLTDPDYWTGFTYAVHFVDSDGTILKSEEVARHGAATPPEPPVHAGQVFSYWNGNYSDVTDTLVIRAVYVAASTAPLGSLSAIGMQSALPSGVIAPAAETPRPGDTIGADASPVTTMISLSEYGEPWGKNPSAMWSRASAASGRRLCFGMSGPYDRTSGGYYDSIKWINGIDVMLVGSPPKAEDPKAAPPKAAASVKQSIGADPSNTKVVDRSKSTGKKVTKQGRKYTGAARRILISKPGDSEGNEPWSPFDVSPDSKPYKPAEKTDSGALTVAIAGIVIALICGALHMMDLYYPQYRQKFRRK